MQKLTSDKIKTLSLVIIFFEYSILGEKLYYLISKDRHIFFPNKNENKFYR